MQIALIILGAGITILAADLLIVSLLSYLKVRNLKLILISIVFSLFFIKGVIMSYHLFYNQISPYLELYYLWFFDLIILVLLYITSIKR